MNQFKERMRKFYKTYERDKNGRRIYEGSIAYKERKGHLYLGTVSCLVIDENNNETPTQAMIREYIEELHEGNEEEQEAARNEAIQN